MKLRESGMPEEAYWETLLDVPLILGRLGIDCGLSNVVEFGWAVELCEDGLRREAARSTRPPADTLEIEGLVLGSRLPAVLGEAGLEFDNLVEDVLPGALADHRVAVFEVNPGEAEIHGGLFAGFVEGHKQALGLGLVFGLEALEGRSKRFCDGGTGDTALS